MFWVGVCGFAFVGGCGGLRFAVVVVCDVWVCVLGGCDGLWFAVMVIAGGGDQFGGLDYWDFSGFWILRSGFFYIYISIKKK